MNILETDRDEREGNTKPLSRGKTQCNQLKSWFFTFNNYLETDISILENRFKEICKKFIFQEEICPSSGTPHLQGCLELKTPMRWSEFKLNNKIHWEKTNKIDKAFDYCGKERTRKPNGIVVSFGFPKPLKTLTNLYQWQKEIETLALSEPDGRSINWFYDNPGGKGKSSFCKYMVIKHNSVVIQGGKLADIMNIIFNTDMDNVNTVIIDVPRINKNKVSYASIECILNGMITNTKYETGRKIFNPPNIIVFSNYLPDGDLENYASKDRWKIKEITEEGLLKEYKEIDIDI